MRILRVARLAARFGNRGFSVAHATNGLMRKMVADGEVDYLVPERVWAEVAKALATDTPVRFFSVLHGCHALAVLFPEIEREYASQLADHGHRDLPTALSRLQRSARYSNDPQVRFATLMVSLGADLDTAQRLRQAESLCERYRIPNDYTRAGAARHPPCGWRRATGCRHGARADAGRRGISRCDALGTAAGGLSLLRPH